jgi:hypothetical protein
MNGNDRVSPRFIVMLVALLGSVLFFSGPTFSSGNGKNTLGKDTSPQIPYLGSLQKAKVVSNLGRLPLRFIENKGQKDQRVKYYAEANGSAIFFTDEGPVIALSRTSKKASQPLPKFDKYTLGKPGSETGEKVGISSQPVVIRLTPVGMVTGAKLDALETQRGKSNYFVGKDPMRWRTNISTYGAVLYRNAYPGIDLKFYGVGRQLEYDIIMRPGSNINQVTFNCNGIKGLSVNEGGDLVMELADGGALVQKKPLVYQEISGRRVAREGEFKIRQKRGSFAYGFEVAAYDRHFPLVVDPVLEFSTYLGGKSFDFGYAIAADSTGVYVTGYTFSGDFPTKPSTPGSNSSSPTVFVSKFDSDGGLLYSTFLGGGNEVGYGIAVQGGCAYVTGAANTLDFPHFREIGKLGGNDIFVTKLDESGALSYSTLIGGSGLDAAYRIAVDASDCAWVTGITYSSDFPTELAAQSKYAGEGDAFVVKLNSYGTGLLYSTYLGGRGHDAGNGISLYEGCAYIAGSTNSSKLNTSNAYQTRLMGGFDAFVAKFGPGSTPSMEFFTYLGGSKDDWGEDIAVNGGGVHVTGYTLSTDFPVMNPFQAKIGSRKYPT